MRKPVILLLLASLVLTAYVALFQGDDAGGLAPPTARDRSDGAERSSMADAKPAVGGALRGALPARAGARDASARPQALAAALDAWQWRTQMPGLPSLDDITRQPWASQQPPPPPPPPPVVAEAPPPPMAPRFPHDWVGRYLDPQPRAIIASTANTWVVKAGDVLDGQWRVDAIAERQMTLTYLPLDQTQSVAMK